MATLAGFSGTSVGVKLVEMEATSWRVPARHSSASRWRVRSLHPVRWVPDTLCPRFLHEPGPMHRVPLVGNPALGVAHPRGWRWRGCRCPRCFDSLLDADRQGVQGAGEATEAHPEGHAENQDRHQCSRERQPPCRGHQRAQERDHRSGNPYLEPHQCLHPLPPLKLCGARVPAGPRACVASRRSCGFCGGGRAPPTPRNGVPRMCAADAAGTAY